MAETRAPEQQLLSAGRFKAFIDAVVAIALTLLILPLMESVTDAADKQAATLDWLQEHQGELASFLISFVVIAMFWINHHSLFAGVHFDSTPLIWLTFGWLLTIVWLPVATSISSQFEPDAMQKALYIGSMAVTSALSGLTSILLLRRPSLHDIAPATLRSGILGAFTASALFVVSLAVAIIFPAVSYWALLLLFLAGPLQVWFAKVVGARD